MPDPARHRICRRCQQWFEPEEGEMRLPEVTGPLTALRQASGRGLRFQCHTCSRVRSRRKAALWIALASLVGLILLLERLGVLAR